MPCLQRHGPAATPTPDEGPSCIGPAARAGNCVTVALGCPRTDEKHQPRREREETEPGLGMPLAEDLPGDDATGEIPTMGLLTDSGGSFASPLCDSETPRSVVVCRVQQGRHPCVCSCCCSATRIYGCGW